MLNWLTGNWNLFGLAGQNWMWLIGSGLLCYIATLLVTHRRAGLH
ncbi:MAG TPA: hypothetical protein VHV56_05550 [Pseudolabrys sp.]|jgi:hypothetical protein|nr:hypothetical protein [Pseudolabrys sp.]